MSVSKIIGAVAATLAITATGRAQVGNGGFETGDLSAWAVSGRGSAQVLSLGDLGTVGPSEGRFFALLGNGPGDVLDDGAPDVASLASAPFTVAMDSILSLEWNFLTAEFTGADADPDHLDGYRIALVPQGGGETLLASGDVGQGVWTLLEGGNPVAAPDGTAVIEQSGFRRGAFPLAPGTYTLVVTVFDSGDGSFDSALALDAVQVAASVAPEPRSIVYLPLALLPFLARCFAKEEGDRGRQ
jgi:hypothetical protein